MRFVLLLYSGHLHALIAAVTGTYLQCEKWWKKEIFVNAIVATVAIKADQTKSLMNNSMLKHFITFAIYKFYHEQSNN